MERRLKILSEKAHRVAFAYLVSKGRIPRVLCEILAATKSLEAFKKYNPDQPRVPAGSPDGGQWTDGGVEPSRSSYPKSSVKSRADAERLVRESGGRHIGVNSQCASLTRNLAPQLPPTRDWKPGVIVHGHTDIPVGTPIATFNFQGQPGTNGYGPVGARSGLSGWSHTGIYLGQNRDGVSILHQHPKTIGPELKIIPWRLWNGKPQEAGLRYYTIDY